MHEHYMALAIEEAKKCALSGDVPVGCVIVKNGEIIGRGHNTRERDNTALGHAEINAISMACSALSSWRLEGCDMYVTLEPCPMCAGAIIHSKINSLYFGAYDKKGGAVGGVIDLFFENFNHKPKVTGGILGDECKELLTEFFKKLR